MHTTRHLAAASNASTPTYSQQIDNILMESQGPVRVVTSGKYGCLPFSVNAAPSGMNLVIRLVKMAQAFDWSILWCDRDRINSPGQSKENCTPIPCQNWNETRNLASTFIFVIHRPNLPTFISKPNNSQIKWMREGLLVLAMPGTKGVPVHEPGQGVRSLAIEQKQPRSRTSPVPSQQAQATYFSTIPQSPALAFPDFHHPSFS